MELTRDAVLSTLREIYGVELEYPAEVLTEDADLEMDLGIDSLSRAEPLVGAGQRFGFGEEFLNSLAPSGVRTLGQIADRFHAGVGVMPVR